VRLRRLQRMTLLPISRTRNRSGFLKPFEKPIRPARLYPLCSSSCFFHFLRRIDGAEGG
jgi:hypothetical protein